MTRLLLAVVVFLVVFVSMSILDRLRLERERKAYEADPTRLVVVPEYKPDGQVVNVELRVRRRPPQSNYLEAAFFAFVAALFAFAVARDRPDAATNDVDYSTRLVDAAALPEVYTGQLVDLDLDDRPDVALFGDPAAPVIEPFERESSPNLGWIGTAVAAVAVLIGTLIAPVVSAWAQRRYRPMSEPDESRWQGAA